jgi:Txe/YoeB family toxin of Txe-Axe toxin-antitoxin module
MKHCSNDVIILDPKNWQKSYLSMVRHSLIDCIEKDQKLIDLNESARIKIPKLQVTVSDEAIVQYWIYWLILNDVNSFNYLTRQMPKKDRSIFIDMANNAIARIKEICNILKKDFYPPNSKKLITYKVKNIKYPTYSIHIDNTNRFVYNVIPERNISHIMDCMFHYDDKPKGYFRKLMGFYTYLNQFGDINAIDISILDNF